MDTIHKTVSSAVDSCLAMRFRDEMLAQYLRANGITRIEVSRHHLGEPFWSVWEMSDKGTCGGWYTNFKRLGDAKHFAKILGDHTGLPVSDR